jgi:hypothetical protein
MESIFVSANILVLNHATTRFEIIFGDVLAHEIIISHENCVELRLYISIHSLFQSKKTSEIINSEIIVCDLVLDEIDVEGLENVVLFCKILLTCHVCPLSIELTVLIPVFCESTPVIKMGSITCPPCQTICQL